VNRNDIAPALPRTALFALGALAVSCVAAFLYGAVGEPDRVWANLLIAGYGLLGLGLGAAVLLALLSVTGARWSDDLRPVVERLTELLVPGGAIVAIVLISFPALYPWARGPGVTYSPFQAMWLNRPFFLLRAFVYLVLWVGLVFLLVRASRRRSLSLQETSNPDASDPQGIRISAAFLVAFALTCWLASTDWIMSLEPNWSSTIFGVYHFAGMFLGALAAVVVLAFWFDRLGAFGGRLSSNRWRDLGTLLFSFSSFWMYIWLSQYLLIWYVNHPDETDYYVRRLQEPWLPLFIASLVLNWGVPFLVLLFRPAKENSWVLLAVAIVVLLGRWVDLYLMVLPPVVGSTPSVGWDPALLLGTAALAALILARPVWGGARA
jgi:hypothetical protein